MLGGHAADRLDRRLLALLAMGIMLAGGVLLYLLNLHGMPSAAWPFYLVQGMTGLGRAFSRPALQALRTELLPREAFANAATWKQLHLPDRHGPRPRGRGAWSSASAAHARPMAPMCS